MSIQFDYLLAVWWLIAMVLFLLPMAIAESIERRKYARHTKRLYRVL